MKDCFLLVDKGLGPNTVYPLMDEVTIGRSTDSSIDLPDRSVSRIHAKVTLGDGSWTLEDLGSANGIIFQGKRVDKIVLTSGDTFKIGKFTFRFIEREIPEARDHFFETISVLANSIGGRGLPAENLKVESRWGQKLQRVIAEIPFFSHLGETERKRIVDGGTLHIYSGGDKVIREGDEGRSIYAILDGKVRVYTRDHQGEELELAVLGASQFFGEISFFSGKPRSSTVAALDESLIIEFNFATMQKLIQKHSPAETVIINYYQERLADLKEKVAGGKG